jgi:ribonuclease HIII
LEVARDIRRTCQDKFVVVEISAERYNQLYTKLENEKKSLNDLLAWAHAKAIEELLSKVECQTAIVDQFADEKLLHEKLQEQGKKLKVIQAHRAESHIAVAAASILARERFVNKLDKLGTQYQTKLPKGASKAVVAIAKQLVERNGGEILEKIAKIHFKTTKEVLS